MNEQVKTQEATVEKKEEAVVAQAQEAPKAPVAQAPKPQPKEPEAPKVEQVKKYRAVISGSYRASNKDVIDFDDLVVYLPYTDEDVALMHIRGRYAVMAITKAKKQDGEKRFPLRVEDLRQVFIDSLKVVEGDQFSFVGKDIKELDYDELQDLATAKDLRRIPLPKELSGVSLREMRSTAYASYSEEILGTKKIDDEQLARFHDLPEIKADGVTRRDRTIKMSNDEIIDREQAKQDLIGGKSKDNLTMAELKHLAQTKNVKFYDSISFDELYAKVMGGGATSA